MSIIKAVAGQTIWQVLGKAVSSISSIIILSLVTRTYGESGTGLYTLVLTYLSFFFLAVDFGLNGYILPKLTLNWDYANKLFNFRFYWSLFLINIANFLTLVLPFSSNEFKLAVFLGSFSILFFGLVNSANLIFQNKLKYKLSIVASSAGALAALSLVYFFSSNRYPPSLLIFTTTLNFLVSAFLALYLVKKDFKFFLELPELKSYLEILKKAWPISLTLIVNTVYFRVDSFILAAVWDFVAVGVYNLSYSMFQTVLVIPTFIMNAYYPLMLISLRENKLIFFKELKLVLGLLGILGILGGVLTYLFSPVAIKIIAGDGFFGGTEALRILSLGLPAFFVSALLMWVFVALGKYKQLLIIYSIGLAVNLLLNLLFIPAYSFYGASFVTVFCEYLILALLAANLKRHDFDS